MTVSLRADLSGLDAGLRRAQELVSRSAAGLAQQEERFRRAGSAARDYGDGASRWLTRVTGSVDALGRSTQRLERRWSVAWEAMDAAADAALRRITWRFARGVASMIVDGRGLRDFWRGLWRDLLETAVHRLMQMVLETRSAAGAMHDVLSLVGGGLFGGIGGLFGDLFGGVGKVLKTVGSWFGFDNPIHDAWARKQGFDFAKHFRAGVAAAMAMPAAAPPTLGPALAVAGMGSIGRAAFQAVSLNIEHGAVQISAQTLDGDVVREAGDLLADEVSQRLGWTDRRSGLG